MNYVVLPALILLAVGRALAAAPVAPSASQPTAPVDAAKSDAVESVTPDSVIADSIGDPAADAELSVPDSDAGEQALEQMESLAKEEVKMAPPSGFVEQTDSGAQQ